MAQGRFCALQKDVERLDPRGRTPLELAVCLGHLESARVLLRYTADPTHCNAQSWTSEYRRPSHTTARSSVSALLTVC